MDDLATYNYITEANSEKVNYNEFLTKTPNLNSKIHINFYPYPFPFFCKCHCHSRERNFLCNISCSRINYQKPIEINMNLEQKNYLAPHRNKSMHNLLICQNNNSFEELKRKYKKNYNDNNNNLIFNYKANNISFLDKMKKGEMERNYSSPNLIKNQKENYNNYNYKNINLNNNDIYHSYNLKDNKKKYMNKYNNEFMKPNQLKRKELAKFYHIAYPKKYSYGGEQLETANNADNHQYIEVIGTSSPKDKNSNKSRVINYINPNNTKVKIKINKYNPNINKKNYVLFNSRYKTDQNSPKKISRNNILYVSKEPETEIKQNIIKETKNTRLIESKNLKQFPSGKYLDCENNNYKNNLNNNIYHQNNNHFSNGLSIENNDYLYQKDKAYNINNNINRINNFNSIINNRSSINDNNPNYNNYQTKTYTNKLKYIPKSYSVKNLNKNGFHTNPFNIKAKYKNQYDNNFSNNNQNNNYKNDYEKIKMKVKMALLKKQINDKKKQKIFNREKEPNNMDSLKNQKYLEQFLSKEIQKPSIINGKSLLSKTKKLLEEKNRREKKNDQNYINMQDDENKILYSLQKNLIEKNNNKINIIKPK